jgi:hypothetical protein
MITTKAVMDSLLDHAADVESLAALSRFRREFHACLTARRDETFELADAVLCTVQYRGAVTSAGVQILSAIAEVPARLATSSGGVGTRRVRWLDGA